MARNAAETRFASQRDKILRAAATCFNQKGFSGTSLKDVSRHLGLTDAALYYYVKNKEELVYQCYLRAAELGREAMERGVAEGRSGLEQATLYIRYHVEIMVGEEGPVAIMSEIPSLRRNHRNEILEISRRHSSAFEEILRRGIEDGSIASWRREDDGQCHHGCHQLDTEVVPRQGDRGERNPGGVSGHPDPGPGKQVLAILER